MLKDIKPEEARSAAEDLLKLYDRLTVTQTREIQENALDIAISLNITFYDALYIATAQKIDAALYTSDQKLCTAANKKVKFKLMK